MNTLKKRYFFFGETFAPFFQTGGRVFYFIGKSISTGNSPCDAMQALGERFARWCPGTRTNA
jgi:hypothetical protein